MVDDKGITVQGGEPNGAQLAAAARLRNDLDRDGTQDHLAGTSADSRARPDWETFAREREDERERLQSNYQARRSDLHQAGAELHTAMGNDPRIAESSLHGELGESLKAENAAFPLRMTQAINAAKAELDRRAKEPGDKAAEAWKVGEVRVGVVAASAAYERARMDLAENTNLQHSVDRSARNLRDAGLQLQDGMSRDPQWQGTAAEAELQASLQEDVARRHPERMALAVRDVVDELDRQAHEGKAAGQMWQDSDLRKQVIRRHDQFVRDMGNLDVARRQAAAERAMDAQRQAADLGGFADAAAPAWEAQHDPVEARELRGEAMAEGMGIAKHGHTGAPALQAEPSAQGENGRWTVQQLDVARGVYRDTLTTDDVAVAHAELQKSNVHRVLDNELKDIAADYVDVDLGGGNSRRQLEFHGRSEFEQQLVAAGVQTQPDTLQTVLERRALLDATVLQRSDAISDAVDRARDPNVPDQEVASTFADASRKYAEVMREASEFERAPSQDESLNSTYRQVLAAEKQIGVLAAMEVAARDNGDDKEANRLAALRAEPMAQLDKIYADHGLSREFTKERERGPRNEIEKGLSSEQVARLTGMGKGQTGKAEEADASKTARVVTPSPLPNIGEGHNQVRNHSAFADAGAKDKLIPEDVAARYKQDGQKFLDANDPKKVAFVDKGNRMQTARSFDDKAVEDMVATADARGWSELKVSGDEGFRRKAWIEATARGIEVKGYEPTEKDKLRAEQLGKQTGRANAIEKNEVVEAYRAARDGSAQDKKEAAKKHPELANAFALEQAAKSFAKQRLAPESQDKLVSTIRDSIERDLAQGKKIPEVRLRQERERRQDRGAER